MSTIDVHHDLDQLTIEATAVFDAAKARVWELFTQPGHLEKWFGAPSRSATFIRLDLRAGGRAHYYLDSPDGDRHYAHWDIIEIHPGEFLYYNDRATDADFHPTPESSPVRVRHDFSEHDGLTRVEMLARYRSTEELQRALDDDGLQTVKQSLSQAQALLSE